ncbi:molybdenum cofactor guanylyltransferase [Alienimonas sp. DA493]|uniref:molybdenum cofactor guanylyltransferase n=1 Tax=Alienimonas sp. DA493 TaxID=3373605 RepID=UPI0037541DDD
MTAPANSPAYLLAGGRSRRFGSDKATADRDGVPALTRLAEQLRAAGATSVTAVARAAGQYDDLKVRTIADAVPDAGPLAGLDAALADAAEQGAAWALAASCDLFDLPADWVKRLRTAATPGRLAVAFRPDRWEPFPGLYHVALRPAVRARLAGGDRSLQALLSAPATRAAAVPPPPDWPERISYNTPAELRVGPGRSRARGSPAAPL